MKLKKAIVTELISHRAFDGCPSGPLDTPTMKGAEDIDGPALFSLEAHHGMLHATRLSDGQTWLFSPGMWHGQAAVEDKPQRR